MYASPELDPSMHLMVTRQKERKIVINRMKILSNPTKEEAVKVEVDLQAQLTKNQKRSQRMETLEA